MVAGWAHQRVGEAALFEAELGSRQRAICGTARGRPAIGIDGRKGVDAEIAGQKRQFPGRPFAVADRKDVRIGALARLHRGRAAADEIDQRAIVNGGDVMVGEAPGRDVGQRHDAFQTFHNGRNAHRRLDIAAIAHVKNLMAFIDDDRERMAVGRRWRPRRHLRLGRPREPDRVVDEGGQHLPVIFRRTQRAVFALQDRAHDSSGVGAA